MTSLKYHQLDSERFGLNVFRAIMEEIDARYIINQILENDVDVAIVRIPTIKLNEIHRLEKLAMPFIVTDTLAYYHKELKNVKEQEIINKDLAFHLATQEDHEELNAIVRETFGNYVNHYRVNPFFDNQNVTEGYLDWMQSYADNDPERKCWLVRRDGETIGFGTFNAQVEGKVKGILYGVKPTERGKGIFTDIMRYAQNDALKSGNAEFMRTTTQIENVPVQKIWANEGFCLHHTTSTLHINAMLKKTIFDNYSVPLILHSEEMDSPKISNRSILRQINLQLDFKQNMVTKNHRFVNITNMHSEEEYMLNFSFPTGSKGLLRVTDKAGKTYALVYYDLQHFVA